MVSNLKIGRRASGKRFASFVVCNKDMASLAKVKNLYEIREGGVPWRGKGESLVVHISLERGE